MSGIISYRNDGNYNYMKKMWVSCASDCSGTFCIDSTSGASGASGTSGTSGCNGTSGYYTFVSVGDVTHLNLNDIIELYTKGNLEPKNKSQP